MRHKVKLETLSSVHVGSGDKKVLGIDFLYSPKRIYFLDTLRIGEAIDITANPKIATEWSKSVLDGKQEEFFIDHNVDYRKLSRSVVNYVDEFSDRAPSISMMMRDGRGIAYIPGSSIKGAIRTAIFAQMAENELKSVKYKPQQEVVKWAKDFFGGINADPFRFLRVGDVFFENASMAVINTVQIKKKPSRPRQSSIDTIKQYSEVLLLDNSSSFSIDIDNEGLANAIKENVIMRNVPQFKDVTTLFKAVNKYTQHLVQSEMGMWNGIDGAKSMYDFLDFIDGEIESCNSDECILRIGNGSGKRFITGGILEKMTFDHNAVPKTRRIEIVNDDEESIHYDLLGFVKLTIED